MAAVDSPSSSPIGTRVPPAQTNGFTAFPFPSYIPTVPMSPSGLAEPQAPGNFLGAAAGMTPGKPAAQTPRRAHRNSKVRSPVAAQPTTNSPVYEEMGQFAAGGSPQSAAAGPYSAQEPAAGRGEDTSLPQQFAQTVNLGPGDWHPSAQKPPPIGGAFQRTPILTPGVARRSAQANRARRPTASVGRTPAATAGRTPGVSESPFVREGSPMDWSPFVEGSHAPAAGQTPNGSMGKAQDAGAGGTKLSFEQRVDVAATAHTVPASSEPAEDEADGLHVDMAATKISWVASGTASSSLAADFSELFKFGEAPASGPVPAPASPRQPSQQDRAREASSARPSAAAAPAQPASDTAQTPSPGSSGSFTSGFMNGPAIGVRPSGTSRFGGHAAADRDFGRRATKLETLLSRGHGEGATFGRAGVSAKSEAKSGDADVRPSATASQPPLSQRMGVPENDRARANQASAKPAPVVKPVRAPAARHDQEAAAGGNAPKQTSTSPEDADMRDASPGQSKAEGTGSAADSTAPFGFTEAAMPAGVKSTKSEASKAAAQETPSQAEDDLAARLAAEFRANMDRCLNPEELAETIYDKLCSQPASKAAAQATPSQAEDDIPARLAARLNASYNRTFSPEALARTAELHSEQAAHGGRKLHKGTDCRAESSTGPEFPSQSNEQQGHSSPESGSHPQAHAGTSQQGAERGSFKANGFTLGSFSRLHKKKPPAAAATRTKAATHGAKQEPAAEAGRGDSQTAGVASDSTKTSSLSDVWRTYAQELQAEKAAAAAETAGRPHESTGGAQTSSNASGFTQTPLGTASATAPAESSTKSEAMGSAASFVTARSSPEVESVPDLAETLLKKWQAAAKEQRDTKEEDSLASKLRQQNLGESEEADTAASAGAGAAASKRGPEPPAEPSEQPSVSFTAAAQGATFGFGQAPAAAPGASFGLGQAPKAPRGIFRRSRGRARAAPSRPHPTQPASTATQPPPVPEQTFFTSTQSSTPTQPSTTASDTAAQRPQPFQSRTEQQPIFGFHSASGISPQQQGSGAKSEVRFGWPATEAATEGSSAAGAAEAQTWSFGVKPFSFKSPGSKVRTPSAPRSPQLTSGFTWGQPPPGGVPFAQPPGPPQPTAAAKASSAAPHAEQASSGTAAQPPSSFATARMRDAAVFARHVARHSERHNEAQQGSGAANKVESGGEQPVRMAVFPPEQVPQPQDTATDAGTQAAPPQEQQPRSFLQDVERLRQRGNDAFQRGSYPRSVDLYQRAVESLRQHGVSEGLGKLYSNLAASYLQMDKPYAAIAACNSALQASLPCALSLPIPRDPAEPSFFRARLRMATCCSRLGDLPGALRALGSDATSPANLAEAAGKRADLEALQERYDKVVAAAGLASGVAAGESALSQLEALLAKDQAPFSSTLHRLRAQLLLQLGRKEEAEEMCKVCKSSREPGLQPPIAWPWWLRVQCMFHSGDIHLAVELAVRVSNADEDGEQELVLSTDGASVVATMNVADMAALAQQLRSLLDSKEAGNRAIKEGKADVALQHYNAALAADLPGSAAYAAVLYANRAAAHQKLGQCTLAVADCLRATALNPSYIRAHSRLASVLSELKHRAAEADALERLQALPSVGPSAEAAGIAQRLRAARAAARNATPDHYKVLGVARDADSEEVRRAYKKSALQLHPDKALAQCRFSDRLGSHGVQLLDTHEVQARVRDNADWLFKCVGAAHAAITDPAERRQLDADLATQEGRASSAGYYSNFYTQSPFRPARYSPQSSYQYGRTSDNYYGGSRRKAGNTSSSGYSQPGGSYYDNYRRGSGRQKTSYGGAGSDDSDVDDFDYS